MPSAASTAWLRSRSQAVGLSVLRVAAQTGSLVDMDTRNVWVASGVNTSPSSARRAAWLRPPPLSRPLPDPGQSLAAHVSGLVRIACLRLPQGCNTPRPRNSQPEVAETIGYVSLTFNEHNLGVTRSRGGVEAAAHAVAEEIGRRLPGLSLGLKAAGGSTGAPLTPADLARRMHEAYDPACAV